MLRGPHAARKRPQIIFAIFLASFVTTYYAVRKFDSPTVLADGVAAEPQHRADALLDAEKAKFHHAADCTMDNLWAWLEKHGAVHKQLKTGKFVVQDAGNGDEEYESLIHKERGVYTQVGFAEGDEILRIPNRILLDQEKLEATPLKVVTQLYSNLNQFDYLALLLLHERAKARASFWYPYLCSLPDFPLYKKIFPFFWTANKLQRTSQRVQLWVKQARFNLNQKYNMMFPFLSEKYPDIFPPDVYRIQDFTWAYFVVMSRNWSVKKNETDINILVPLADLLNHDEDSAYIRYPVNAAGHWTLTRKNGNYFFGMVSKRAYNPGEQVYDVYGAVCNDYNLVMYGFTQPSNTRECDTMPWNFV